MGDLDRQAEVTSLEDGTAATLGTSGDYDAPGQVLLVTGPRYALEYLAHEGEVLFEPGGAEPLP